MEVANLREEFIVNELEKELRRIGSFYSMIETLFWLANDGYILITEAVSQIHEIQNLVKRINDILSADDIEKVINFGEFIIDCLVPKQKHKN